MFKQHAAKATLQTTPFSCTKCCHTWKNRPENKTLSQQWLKNVNTVFAQQGTNIKWYLLLIRIKLGNMSYYKNRGTIGTNRHIDFENSSHSRQKIGLCLTATVPNIDFQPPKRQQKAMAFTTGTMNEHKLFAIQGSYSLKGATKLQFYLPVTILKFPDFYGRTNNIKYNSIITLEAQIYQNFLSMTHPTISNTNHSVSSKTSTTTESRLCKIGVCPWHTTNCVKHKSDAHASTHVCVCKTLRRFNL